MEQLIKDVNGFIEICKKLKQSGYKKKDIANVLDIPAPVLSSLLKTVLPSISQIDIGIPAEEIESIVADFISIRNEQRSSAGKWKNRIYFFR